MNTTLTNLLKDMNATAKRVASKPSILAELKVSELKKLGNKLNNYQPKTEAGNINKGAALRYIQKQWAKVAPTLEPDFDPEKISEVIKRESMVLHLTIHQPTFKKRVSAATLLNQIANGADLPSDLDVRYLHLAQDLLDRDAPIIKKMQKSRNSFRAQLEMLIIPDPSLGTSGRQYRIPYNLLDMCDALVDEFVSERQKHLDEFEEIYESLKTKARESRGILYRESDYPSFGDIRWAHRIDARYRDYDVPAGLQERRKDIFEREQESIERELAEATVAIRDALRVNVAGLVEHLSSVLGRDENNEYKIFHSSSVENLKKFLDLFDSKNLTGDKELKKVVEQANKLLDGVDPKKVRNDEALRDALKAGFDEVKEKVSQLVVTKQRRFRLDEV
jgi:hypothetical protein